jgi:hypothetical protein
VQNKVEITALFDTGASTPVWCMGVEKFKLAYPDAIKKEGICKITGFGQGEEIAYIYGIPVFELNGGDNYKIVNLQVAVCMHPQIGYDFIMSDTMFSKTDTLIKRRGNKELIIYYDKEEYNCLVKNIGDSFNITTYSQN